MIATHTTPITWGTEISTTFNYPPNIYIEIFLLGLIVQGLFSVTLVTLSAAAMLYVLNVVYTGSTGMYQFIDFNIHPAVFLGLHLLVTDPATSPRKNFGKVIFGAAYGASVFALVWMAGQPGVLRQAALRTGAQFDGTGFGPRQHCCQRLVRPADGWGKLRPLQALSAWTPRQANFGFMGIWVAFFGFMFATGFIGGKHPGSDPAVWERACAAGHTKGCQVLAQTLDVQCQHNSANGCFTLGTLLSGGKGLPRDPIGAGRSFKQACDLGLESACSSLVNMVKTDGDGVLLRTL